MSNSLNESQIQAVNSYDTPLLILAGAGTGKTTTITTRIANLILNGICPAENILAVTFTNKAAGEMKTRIEKLIGGDASRMWVGTFHGISARILRIYARALGLEPSFLILDEYDRKKLITNVIHDLDIDEKRFPVKVCQFIISSLKEKCIDPNDEDKISTFKYRDLDIIRLYRTYQNRLRAMNAVDFDDLIFECVRLFKREPKILADLQSRFKYITVDEYQDTNEIQHLWLRLLVGSNANICCVGDEDQSIYGWRGAKVDYILNFEKDFPGAKIIRLEQNYRSTQSILDAAMSVISNNKQRYDKTLSSNIKTQDKPNLILVENDRDENANIIKNIISLQNNSVDLRQIAILVRATHQMRGIEDCFIKNSIPYKIIGGIKFYERKEIKDLIAYIRWCYSLTDAISLERIINVPKRGIGEKSFAEILSYIGKNNWNLFDGLMKISTFGDLLNTKPMEQLRIFIEFTSNIHNDFENSSLSLADIVEKIYFNSGYAEMLQNEMTDDPEVENKINNINEFLSSIKQFDTMDQFLEHISLVSASDDENNGNGVNIMTMHAAKGLEFLYVFLPAWEEGGFPSQKSIEENGGLGVEEERRLAYVALTRARKNFFVYVAKQRMQFGKIQLCYQSRFVNEMRDKLNVVDLTYHNTSNSIRNENVQNRSFNRVNGSFSSSKLGYSCGIFESENIEAGEAKKQLSQGVSRRRNFSYNPYGGDYKTTNPYAEAEKREKQFKIGEKVFSEKFGDGVITAIYGKFYEVKFANTKQITKDIMKK